MSSPARPPSRVARFLVVLCLLLVAVIGYDAIHVHGAAGPLGNLPAEPHHYCLLCLAAHLPLTVYVSPAVPLLTSTRPAAVVPVEPHSYESAGTLPLYTRPPPRA